MKTIILSTIFILFCGFQALSQENNWSSDSIFIMNISAKEFDEWALKKVEIKIDTDLFRRSLFKETDNGFEDLLQNWLTVKLNLDKLEAAIMARTKKDSYVSDDVFDWIIPALIEYESVTSTLHTRGVLEKNDDLRTVSFIDNCLKIIYKRPLLEILLLEKRAELVERNRVKKGDNPIEHSVHLVELSDSIRADMLISYHQAAYSLGKRLLQEGSPEKAEPYLVQVMTYSYYKETDPKMVNSLFNLSVEAGKKLLELRANDLEALKETRFIPAAAYTLQPIKDELIAKLKAKNDKK